jgi:hypothetical protein
MLAKKAALTLFIAASFSLGLAALAQTPATSPEDRLVQRYTDLAGSEKNARALVTGLRDGQVGPETHKMGYGNVDNALALTEASLKKQGIANPTPEQVKTALTGVLQMRADGQGWGEIAHSMGFKLGELKRELHRPERIERVAHHAKPERPEKPERREKPDRPSR